MAVTVLIPSPLRRFTGGAHAVNVEVASAGAALSAVVGAFPELAGKLLDEAGKLPPYVHVFVNSQDIGDTGGLATGVPDGGEVLIIQAISGG